MRRRLFASLAAMAAAAALVVGIPPASGAAPQAEAAACSSYPAWIAGQWYDVGAIVSYTNGNAYRAKNANPGYDPIISTWYWEPYGCDSGGGGGTTCSYPNWVAGQWYDVGAIVKYTNGGYYRAKNANPGYDPIISTWYWEPYSCTGNPGDPGTPSGFVVSESQFNQMFPSRNSFYTYAGLTAALSAYPGFANTGSDTVKKQEAAAFLANVSHETGGLVYIVEQNSRPRHDDPAQRDGQRRRFRGNDPEHQRQHRVQRRQPRPGAEPRQQLHPVRRDPRGPDGRQSLLLSNRSERGASDLTHPFCLCANNFGGHGVPLSRRSE